LKDQPASRSSHSIEIFLVFNGSVEVSENNGNSFKRNKGEAWVSFDQAEFEIRAMEDAELYEASIPGMNG
jgi:mannose-6-phosphate isomerase class I